MNCKNVQTLLHFTYNFCFLFGSACIKALNVKVCIMPARPEWPKQITVSITAAATKRQDNKHGDLTRREIELQSQVTVLHIPAASGISWLCSLCFCSWKGHPFSGSPKCPQFIFAVGCNQGWIMGWLLGMTHSSPDIIIYNKKTHTWCDVGGLVVFNLFDISLFLVSLGYSSQFEFYLLANWILKCIQSWCIYYKNCTKVQFRCTVLHLHFMLFSHVLQRQMEFFSTWNKFH